MKKLPLIPLVLSAFMWAGNAYGQTKTSKTKAKTKITHTPPEATKKPVKSVVMTGDTAKVYRDRDKVKDIDFRPPSPTSPSPNNPNPHNAQPNPVDPHPPLRQDPTLKPKP
ncbi:hypothetical protein [Hufsiella ginkgonis]|uniref:Uncharacterized protein n=1 Tax=Hufsiella ginkgonis TaxID=2695274 RepID=A0A7K1XWA0_9SPHI|nr:hypothetical protein [Hufsiella ginkgonis]MXV15250.1 hypothetical protein [Hufsiella ginkgonis]